MDKSFEALYTIAMSMADTCITHQDFKDRMSKLEEEYQELVEAYSEGGLGVPKTKRFIHSENSKEPVVFLTSGEKPEALSMFVKELADVLFVLLHIGKQVGQTPHSLLHMAATKMLARMNDPNYIAKEQKK